MEYAVAAIVGYLLGSVPAALLVARRHGVDLYATGDGNPGAWNALEQLGGRRAWPAFIGDALKGLLAGGAGWAIGGDVGTAYAGVAGAMLGHALPVFSRLRGGKAVMTFVGGMFAVALLSTSAALAVCVATSLAARSFAVGARVGIVCIPVFQAVVDGPGRVIATGALMCLIGLLFVVPRRGPTASVQG